MQNLNLSVGKFLVALVSFITHLGFSHAVPLTMILPCFEGKRKVVYKLGYRDTLTHKKPSIRGFESQWVTQ